MSNSARKSKSIAIVSAHEGATTWVNLCRFIDATTRYEVSSFHQYDDDGYRSARSTWERLGLRIKTFAIFPLRFLLHVPRLARQADLLIVVTSPFYLPVLAALTVNRRKTKIIALMNDIYPEALVAKGILRRGGFVERTMKRMYDRAFRNVAAAVFLSDYHKAFVARDIGLPPQSPVIPVSAHSDPFADHVPAPAGGALQIVYCGTLGLMHETGTFLKWLANQGRRRDVCFSFYTSGACKEKFESQVKGALASAGSDVEVRLGSALNEKDWVRVMKQAHVGLVLQDSGGGKVIFPSKIASILAAGQAVLAVADLDSDIARLIVQHDCGWVVAPNDVAAFDACVLSIARNDTLLGKRLNAFKVGQAMFGKEAVARQWIELCDSLTDGAA